MLDLDFVVNSPNTGVWIYFNDAAGNFANEQQICSTCNNEASAMIVTDIDYDGDMDISMSYYTYHNAGVQFINDGALNFTAYSVFNSAIRYFSIEDMNNDSKADVLGAQQGGRPYIYYDNYFQSSNYVFASNNFYQFNLLGEVAAIHLTEDAFPELLFGGGSSSVPKISMSNDAFTFQTTIAWGAETDLKLSSMSVYDFNQDGRKDVLTFANRKNNLMLSYAGGFAINQRQVQSLKVNSGAVQVMQATFTAQDNTNNNQQVGKKIEYFLSNDGGARWYAVRSGQTINFANNGSDLRWKALLKSQSFVQTQ